MKNSAVDVGISAFCVLAGVAAIGYALAMIYAPLAWLFGGGLLCFVGTYRPRRIKP